MSTDDNKKLPSPPWSDPDSGIKPKYPYVYGERDNNGGYKFVYRDINDYTVASSEEYLPSGSYETIQYDSSKKEIRSSLNSGETRTYTAGGSSEQVDGHVDKSVSSTYRTNVKGDRSDSSGRNNINLTAGQVITAEGPTIKRNYPGSDTISFNSSGGDVVQEHTGNYHESYEKDLVSSVSENYILMVKNGDLATHIQSGNYDTQVKGKTRLFSEDEILIESSTKITIKVGSSTIVVGPSGITINSDRIDLN